MRVRETGWLARETVTAQHCCDSFGNFFVLERKAYRFFFTAVNKETDHTFRLR